MPIGIEGEDTRELRRALRACIRELEAVQRQDGFAPSTTYVLDIARHALKATEPKPVEVAS